MVKSSLCFTLFSIFFLETGRLHPGEQYFNASLANWTEIIQLFTFPMLAMVGT